MKKFLLFLIPLFVLSACNDDVMLSEDIANNEPQVAIEATANGLISMIESCADADITIGGLKASYINNSKGIQVHYVNANIYDDATYKQAYDKGHYFLVSEDNVAALNKVLGREFSVGINSPKVNCVRLFSNLMESEAVDEMPKPIKLSCDSTQLECEVTDVVCDHYLLFNKDAMIVLDVPMYDSLPNGMTDAVAHFFNENRTPKSRTTGSDQLVAAKLMRTLTKNYTYYYKGYKLFSNKQSVTVNYTVSNCYSFDEDCDYYMLEQEVILFNGELNPQKGTIRLPDGTPISCATTFEGYLGYSRGATLKATFGAENISKLGVADDKRYTLLQMSPSTTQGSVSTSAGVNLSLSGSFGLSDSGPSGSISTGVTFTSSRTMNIPDVTVTNKCGTLKDGHDNRYAEWKFEIAWPYSRFKLFSGGNSWKIDEVSQIGKSTCELYASNIWVVHNPKKGYNPIIGVAVSSNTGMTGGSWLWGKTGIDFQQEIQNEEWMTITFPQPYRGN